MIRKLNNQGLKRPRHALYCKIRNEDYFLPHFLAHYRAIGIEHFYFADDQSTDGTREKLLAQPDCTVVAADFRFSEMIDGVQGKNIVSRQVPEHLIGPGWILSVDADEFLVLPEDYPTIGDLTQALDAKGQISCLGAMVDFYPRTLAHRFVDRDLSPFKAFPFFDTGPYFIWAPNSTRPVSLHAGIRHRLNEWMVEVDRDKAWPHYRPTMLHKIPLVKWGHGMFPESNSHITNLPPFIGTQIVLAHFKFYPDLDAKIAEALESNFYQGSSYYYRLLDRYVPMFEHRSLVALVSRRYRGPADLKNAFLLYANGRPF